MVFHRQTFVVLQLISVAKHAGASSLDRNPTNFTLAISATYFSSGIITHVY